MSCNDGLNHMISSGHLLLQNHWLVSTFLVCHVSTLYNNRPVYQCNSNPDLHLFHRQNGHWVVTHGSSLPENYSDGAIVAMTTVSSIVPYGVDWS